MPLGGNQYDTRRSPRAEIRHLGEHQMMTQCSKRKSGLATSLNALGRVSSQRQDGDSLKRSLVRSPIIPGRPHLLCPLRSSGTNGPSLYCKTRSPPQTGQCLQRLLVEDFAFYR